MKDFKDMTSIELNQLKEVAKQTEFTPFAKFMFALKGYEIKNKSTGKYYDKWEAWHMGYCNPSELINQVGELVAVRKVIN